MRRIGCVLIVLALAGCGGGAARQVHYTGALPGCRVADATLTRRGGEFVFTPGDGVLVIPGKVAPDGSFSGSLNTQAPGKPPFLLTVTGHLADEQATLTYTTPRCTAQATFPRAHPPLL